MNLKFNYSTAFKVAVLTLLALIVIFDTLTAQVVDTTGMSENPIIGPDLPLTLDKMLDSHNILFMAFTIIWGYVAKWFGFKDKFKNINFVFIVLAGAVVIIAAFVIYGFSAFPLVFNFLIAIGIYDVIFKPSEKVIKTVIKPANPKA